MGVYIYGITGKTRKSVEVRNATTGRWEKLGALTMKYIGLARDEDILTSSPYRLREARRIERAKGRAREIERRDDFGGSLYVVSGDGKWKDDASVRILPNGSSALWYDCDEPGGMRVGWLRKRGRKWIVVRRTRWENIHKHDDEVDGWRKGRRYSRLLRNGETEEVFEWTETVEAAKTRIADEIEALESVNREHAARQETARRLAEQRRRDERRAQIDAQIAELQQERASL